MKLVKPLVLERAKLIFLGELVWVLCFVFFSLFLMEISRLEGHVLWSPWDSSLIRGLWVPFWIYHRHHLWKWVHCSTSGCLPASSWLHREQGIWSAEVTATCLRKAQGSVGKLRQWPGSWSFKDQTGTLVPGCITTSGFTTTSRACFGYTPSCFLIVPRELWRELPLIRVHFSGPHFISV